MMGIKLGSTLCVIFIRDVHPLPLRGASLSYSAVPRMQPSRSAVLVPFWPTAPWLVLCMVRGVASAPLPALVPAR